MRESEELELAEMIISANKGVKEDQCSKLRYLVNTKFSQV